MKRAPNTHAARHPYRLLPLAFAASAVTGIGLHLAGHGSSHEAWHNWAAGHILTSLLWLIAVVRHLRRHRGWYKSLTAKGPGRKSRTTLALTAAFAAATATGIVLLAWVDGAGSGVGQWHYRLGLLLAALSLGHIVGRQRRRAHRQKQASS